MRYSRMEDRQPPKSSKGKGWAVVVILAAIAIGVYLIAASEAGDFLAKNVIDPVAQAFSPQEDAPVSSAEATDAPKSSAETVSIEIDDFSLYAIQAGVFSDEGNARQYADELIKKGGAGYITEFDDSYRVFISGYLSSEDAEGVRDRLVDEQNMDTSVYEMSGETITINAEADGNTAELLRETDINGGIEELTRLSLARDKGELTAEQAKEELNGLAEQLNGVLEQLEKAGEGELTAALGEYFEAAAQAVESAAAADDEVELSSRMKYAYLAAADARERLSEQLGA